jgi:hypothetical protein
MNSDLAIDTVNKLKKAHCFTSVFEYLNESLTEAAGDENLEATLSKSLASKEDIELEVAPGRAVIARIKE